ncbi:hypothetical protein FF38_11314 [Lucilia cuprina]|uniref:Uncharacterized protein n=1 Tax=Lucilia cuprina TaxID=7375 RepID=A0A0L0CIF3_LUCCU|nr:hypothetical protein FF38_11314 [Lucilia cuprina]
MLCDMTFMDITIKKSHGYHLKETGQSKFPSDRRGKLIAVPDWSSAFNFPARTLGATLLTKECIFINNLTVSGSKTEDVAKVKNEINSKNIFGSFLFVLLCTFFYEFIITFNHSSIIIICGGFATLVTDDAVAAAAVVVFVAIAEDKEEEDNNVVAEPKDFIVVSLLMVVLSSSLSLVVAGNVCAANCHFVAAVVGSGTR